MTDREKQIIKEIALYLYENDYVETTFDYDEDEAGHTSECVNVGTVFEDGEFQDALACEVEMLALEHAHDIEEMEEARRSAIYC